MPNSYIVLDDPLQQEDAPRTARCNWKVLVLASLFISLGCVGLWSAVGEQNPEAQEIMNAIALPNLQPAKTKTSQFMASSPFQRMQPASQFRNMAAPALPSPHLGSPLARYSQYQPQVQVDAMRSSYMPTVPALSASSMTRSRMQSKVNAAMSNLNMYGLGNPLAKFGLTVVAARNDPSMTPLVREEFFNMDSSGQKTVMNLRRDVIVRAANINKEDMAGQTAPLGFWDPLTFSDKNSGLLWFYREAELKHGRVAMLATVGILTGDAVHPFFGNAVPYTGWLEAQKVAPFWPGLLLGAGFLELMNGNVHSEETWEKRDPGDFSFDPLGMKPKDAAGLKELQNKELNNGRLAMFAAMGLMFQEMVKDTPGLKGF